MTLNVRSPTVAIVSMALRVEAMKVYIAEMYRGLAAGAVEGCPFGCVPTVTLTICIYQGESENILTGLRGTRWSLL